MVERWTLPFDFGGPEMAISESGKYVRFTDYEALERQIAELREELDAARKDVAEKSGSWVLNRCVAAEADKARLSEAIERALQSLCGDYPSMAVDLRAALSGSGAGGWRTIESAPKDGTRVLIWVVHPHAKYSDDPVADGWAAAYEAHWIDHNHGGWTWHGILGEVTHWCPLPAAPTGEAS